MTDAFKFRRLRDVFTDEDVQPQWREAWECKEMAFRTRFSKNLEWRKEHALPLSPLAVGQRVLIQNQHGNDPLRWDRSGVVVEAGTHDSYSVRLDGSGRLSKRNRTHLRPVQAHNDDAAPHLPLATLPNYVAQGARPRTRAMPPAEENEPAPALTPPPPPTPVAAEDAPTAPPTPPPVIDPPPILLPIAVGAPPAPDPPPATPPRVPELSAPAAAPRRNPPRERRAPARLLEHCAVAYKEGDFELADDIINCVIGMLRLQ